MSRSEQKEQTRLRILNAAGRGFRESGFSGIGVDGLAKGAGVTSGAFYIHFPSKEAAFTEIVGAGIDELRLGVVSLRETHGTKWVEALVEFYIGYKRVCDLGESCALQTLIPEVGRTDERVKTVIETHLKALAETVADGLPGGDASERMDRAIALLAVLSGGVTLARAVQDESVSEAIGAAIRRAALDIGLGTTAARRGRRTAS